MDDALSMLALYAGLAAGPVGRQTIAWSRRLLLEFQSWVLRERALRKVFVSIKGIYYQADVAGTRVTWIMPHKFMQEVPLSYGVSSCLCNTTTLCS
jgi:pescadillo